jgi:lipooligosaccharide transport system ATP-binding protein
MRMIACVSPRTDGRLSVLGLDPQTDAARIKARIGVVPQLDNLDLELSVWDNLIIYGRYFGLPRAEVRARAEELLEFAQLADRRDDRVDPLSGGMRRRLTIARGLLNRPDLLLLDEPTTGLDPQARHLLWQRLWGLKRDGVTLVLTTHYMEEAEQLCDRLVIMDQGTIAAEGSPRDLVARYCTREVVELRYPTPEAQATAVTALGPLAERVEPLPDRVLVYADNGDATIGRVNELDGSYEAVLVRRGSLEDVFLRLTGRTLED